MPGRATAGATFSGGVGTRMGRFMQETWEHAAGWARPRRAQQPEVADSPIQIPESSSLPVLSSMRACQGRYLPGSAPRKGVSPSTRRCTRRHLIENFFGKLKEFKRIAMRADKNDQSFAYMIHLTAVMIALDQSQQALGAKCGPAGLFVNRMKLLAAISR
jgi:transposase